MGNADAHSRRGNTSDLYATPFGCVRALVDKLDLRNKAILDPCNGTGVVGKVLRQYGYDLVEYDILTGGDFFKEERRYDIILTNPPYSKKAEFIEKAWEIADDIYFILPMNVCNYNSFQQKYMHDSRFMGKYLMTPKFFMSEAETENPKRGGISAYAWFHWCGNKGSLREVEDRTYEEYIDLRPYFQEAGE